MTLNSFHISRCYKPKDFGTITKIELHHFADASQEHGYGTVSYLRFINDKGEIHCTFVLGKSRVKPLNSALTVPKLELTASTLAVKMNKTIMSELSGRLEVDSITYWTDSIIVLRYIFNEVRRFVTFVANRVAVIRQESEPSQWRYVKSELNPADLASRGIKASDEDKLETWKLGPDFLWTDATNWPEQPIEMTESLSTNDEGVKKEKVTSNAATVQTDFWKMLFQRYSTWNRLRRVVAWLLRIVRRWQIRTRVKGSKNSDHKLEGLTVTELKEAERKIVQLVQKQSFPDEAATNKGQLARLKPFVEKDLIRVGGRLNRSSLDHEAKHPLVLPSKHPVTEMIIRHYHQQEGHCGVYHTLAEIRQRFWIVNGASTIKKAIRGCHICKRNSAKLGEQMTSPLPQVRVSSDEDQLVYPFAAVGLDYFGPLYVKTGMTTRSKKNQTLNKRYGCIFTCLRYRAVHLELAQDLSTDSFLNAVTRFVSRRGPPRTIYSDNGTNFVGAETDIISTLKKWNQERISNKLSSRDIQWYFNPPAASHQGGVWERLIRSVRRILQSLVGECVVTEDTLRTVLIEIEKIMNDRPITPVSSDPRDLEAMTPNHVLLFRRNPSSAPDDFTDADTYKATWKHVHHLATAFWQRWTKEYLPMLQERQKWLQKRPNFRVGDLVLVADKNTPRGQWPKGILEQTFPDQDGVVRQVILRTANGTYRRDIRKLCLLEGELIERFEQQKKQEPIVKKK